MHHADQSTDTTYATRIPSDISRSDRLLGPFTARQCGILAIAALVLYGGWWASRPFMAPLAYVILAIPIAGATAALALGSREGVGLDRFLVAGLAHARARGQRVDAPEGVPPLPAVVPGRWSSAAGPPPAAMRMPYEGITADGVLDLKREGKAALATCSTVNFELRSAGEQQSLTAGFARWLNSITGPVQILVRSHPVDLATLAEALQERAAGLPHPALERAARAHADFLTRLVTGGNVLGRQVVLVTREEAAAHGGRRGAGEARVVQRVAEATRALTSAEITVRPLDARQSVQLVAAACNPESYAPPADHAKGDLA
ncbi:PrgI family mobile element protein [Streptomyces buecherae]|uniref:PrgI family mobile element protein n=1 Tax=Streptomyces buecherae TaxID=2763006 RepID=UPI0033D357F4